MTVAREALIDEIYEAASSPEYWPRVLQSVSDHFEAAGAIFLSKSLSGPSYISSEKFAPTMEAFVSLGWAADNQRTAPLIAELHPGFRTDRDYRSLDHLRKLPVFAEFLIPRGIEAGAATVIQGSRHDAIALTVEGFQSHEKASLAVASLNVLRPHFSRALSLTSQLQDARIQGVVDGLSAMGTAAAVLDRDGKMKAFNAFFDDQVGPYLSTQRARPVFRVPALQRSFTSAVQDTLRSPGSSRSIGLRLDSKIEPIALHLIPLLRGSREIFGSDGLLILAAGSTNSALPGADLLGLLFDLTPAEARLARHLLDGKSLAQAASSSGTTAATARTQLKAVFAKTGVSRQSELIGLLSRYREPQL